MKVEAELWSSSGRLPRLPLPLTSKKSKLEKTETEIESETCAKDRDAIEKLSRKVKIYQKQLQDMKNKYQQVTFLQITTKFSLPINSQK